VGCKIFGPQLIHHISKTKSNRTVSDLTNSETLDSVYNETLDSVYNETLDSVYNETLDSVYNETLDSVYTIYTITMIYQKNKVQLDLI